MGKSLPTVRGSVYGGLAFAFSPPGEKFYRAVESKLLCALKSLASALAWPSLKEAGALSDLVEKEQHGPGNELASIKTEYHRLFVGPYQLVAPPYASLYLESEPTVMGQSTLEVLRMYEEAGFVLSPSFKDLPDHIAAELEFMALLCEGEKEAWKREDFSQALTLLSREETFLKEHLVRWIPKFSMRILSTTDSPFYRALASLVQDYVFLDLEGVRAARRLLEAGGTATRVQEGTRDGA